MSADHTPLTRKVGATFAAASILGTMGAACSSDGDSTASEPTTGDTTTTSAEVEGATTSFANLADDESVTTTEYVGAIEGTDTYAAFSVSRATDTDDLTGGIAYFCDGESTAQWFRIVDAADGLTFESASGDSFTAEVDDDGAIVADVPLGGETYSVTAEEVDADGEAGLYLADHAIDADLANDERGGWIVLTDGTQRGAIRAANTVLPGSNLQAGTTNVAVAGRDILLRAITHIIGLDKKE